MTLKGEPAVIGIFYSQSSSLWTKSGKSFAQGQKFYVEAVAAHGKPIWRTNFEPADLSKLAGHVGFHLERLFPSAPQLVKLQGQESLLLHVGKKLFAWISLPGRNAGPRWTFARHPCSRLNMAI